MSKVNITIDGQQYQVLGENCSGQRGLWGLYSSSVPTRIKSDQMPAAAMFC